MNKAAFSVFVYSFYMLIMGVGFIFIPNLIITTFGFQPTTEIWIRMLGMLSAVTGSYYMVAAKNNLIPFFKISVWGRLFFTLGEITLVVAGLAPMVLLLFAIIEGAGAVWTQYALRRSNM